MIAAQSDGHLLYAPLYGHSLLSSFPSSESKKEKGKKKKQIKFEILIKRFLANRGGNVRDTRRKFIFPQQLLLFVCKKRKKENQDCRRICQQSITVRYEREVDKKKKRKKMEEEEEQSEER